MELACRILATHPVFGLRSRLCGSHRAECSPAIFVVPDHCYGHYVRATTWNSFGVALGCVFSSRVRIRFHHSALVFFLNLACTVALFKILTAEGLFVNDALVAAYGHVLEEWCCCWEHCG